MRKLMRNIARANMRRAGVRKMNKQRYSYNPVTRKVAPVGSYFSENWRAWV